jgi:hypothetical protein
MHGIARHSLLACYDSIMPHASALDGVRAKIARAEQHLKNVHLSIHSILATKEKEPTASHYYDPERQELIVRMEKTTPLDPTLPLVVGDCIHNARSALDHLVFQLAILNGAAGSAARKTSFPVCLSPSDFRLIVARRVAPFISNTALDEIEKLQPYAHGNAGRDDVLYVLAKLDNIDKHRLVIVTIAKFRPIAFCITLPNGDQFRHEITPAEAGEWKPTTDGAEIIRFDLSEVITEPGRVTVKLNTVSTAQFEQTGLICDSHPMQLVLSDCIQHVTNIVDEFGRLFFGE